MTVLNSADWPAVREAIDVSLDDVTLPDATIARPLYAGRAESWIAARVTGSLSADEEAHAGNAAILYLASLLAPQVPALTMENIRDGASYQRASVDREAQAADLYQQAIFELTYLPSTEAEPLRVPSVFRTASARRGR